MRAMILAAGYGTRLWPLTADRAKPAIPFLGRPLVGYVAEYLARNNFHDIIVNLHHQPDSVRSALGNGSRFGVHLRYVEEPEILGTSGALDNARELLLSDGETFLVINGKIVTDINLHHALATHRRTGAMVTMILRHNPQRERFSMIETQDGFVTGFGGMPQASDNAFESMLDDKDKSDAGPLMFTGIQLMEPDLLSFVPQNVYSHSVTDVFPKVMASGARIAAHIADDGIWYELSTIPRYVDISLALMPREGKDVWLESNSKVDANADIKESILWNNVTISRGARVRRAVLGDGVKITEGEQLENVAVIRAELVRGLVAPPKSLDGAIRGENFVVQLPQ